MVILFIKIANKDVIIFNGVTHIIISLFMYYLLFPLNLNILIAIAIGSLFPDIDTPYSMLGRYNIFSFAMKHRGMTHTLMGLIISAWIVNSTFSHITSGFVFGYVMHLLADGLTPMGIMWLHPLKREYYSLWKKKKPS